MIKFLPNIFKNRHIKSKTTNIKIVLLLVVSTFTLACKNKTTLPDPLQAGWNNNAVCEVVEDNPKIRVLKCTFPPGIGHERHYHASHFGYTIKGSKFKIKDTTGTRIVNVPTGTEFYNEGIEWHEVVNVGDSTAVFLIIEPKTN